MGFDKITSLQEELSQKELTFPRAITSLIEKGKGQPSHMSGSVLYRNRPLPAFMAHVRPRSASKTLSTGETGHNSSKADAPPDRPGNIALPH